jgi:hypothetical protein
MTRTAAVFQEPPRDRVANHAAPGIASQPA